MHVAHRLSPSPSAETELCYANAHAALSEGKLAVAGLLFAHLLSRAPQDERAWLGLGLCSEKSGHPERALVAYSVGTLFSPRSAWLSFGQARAQAALGDAQAALAAFDRAEALSSEPALLAAILEERSCL